MSDYLKINVSGAISYHEENDKYIRHNELRVITNNKGETKNKIVDISLMDSFPQHTIENLYRVLLGQRPRGIRAKKEANESAYSVYDELFVELPEIAESAKNAKVVVNSGIGKSYKGDLTYIKQYRTKRTHQLGDAKWMSYQWKGDNGWVSVSLFNKTNFAYTEFNWNRIADMCREYIGNLTQALSELSGIAASEFKNLHPFDVFEKAYSANKDKKELVINELIFKPIPDFFKNIIRNGEANIGCLDYDVSVKAADIVAKRNADIYIPITEEQKKQIRKTYATFLDSGVAEVIGFVTDYEIPRDAKPAYLANDQQQEKA